MKEKMSLIDACILAERHGWRLIDNQLNIGMCSFTKQLKGYSARVNVYRTTMTVATAINHPKRGKNQLYRKKVSVDLLEQIFINPRVHTSKGYRKK